MPFYQKKPFIIEAAQYDGTLESVLILGIPEITQEFTSDDIIIPTLEGDMRCRKGDYIIRGIQGEFYPIKEEIFLQSYEQVLRGLK